MCRFIKIGNYVVNTENITFFRRSDEWLYIFFADKNTSPLTMKDSENRYYNALCQCVQAQAAENVINENV